MAKTSSRGSLAKSAGLLLGLVAIGLLTACAPVSGPAATGRGAHVTSSPSPTEREGETDETNSKAFKNLMSSQKELERFDAWVRAQPGVYGHGFISTVDDPATTSVTLLWFGTDPWRDRFVAAGARRGVQVHFQQRAQSLASFEAAQQRLMAAGARLKALGFTTVSISGISADPQPLTLEGTFSKGADRAALTRLATQIARQPVLLKPGSAAF